MELIHKICGGAVYIDVTEFFKIQTRFRNFSSREGIVYISDLRIDLAKQEGNSFNFVCSKCGREHLSFDDLLGQCGNCGELTPIMELVRSPRMEGTSCKKAACIRYINKYGTVPLTDVFKKLVIE